MPELLAVDLGIKCGLALYQADGRLRWYRSHNFGSAARLRRAVRRILDDLPGVSDVVLEGGGRLADIWTGEAQRRALTVHQIAAETWRRQFLYPRQRRSGSDAKQYAKGLARRVIEWSQAPRPTALRDDTAEAILVGLWGTLELGWLTHLPNALQGSESDRKRSGKDDFRV
jgi:hypothetical protein